MRLLSSYQNLIRNHQHRYCILQQLHRHFFGGGRRLISHLTFSIVAYQYVCTVKAIFRFFLFHRRIKTRRLAQCLNTSPAVWDVWGSNPDPITSAQFRQRLATAATFLWELLCSQALGHEDGPCYSLHTSSIVLRE